LWLPIVALSLVLDRAYHVVRFGWDEAFSTYIHLFGAQARARNPELPVGYPFSGSFVEGFFGPLFSRNRSMFLFDPLALAGVALFVWAAVTRRLPKPVILLLGASAASLFGRLVVYARYAHWDGSSAWSNRFTLTPLQVALLFVIPTFLAFRERLGRVHRAAFGVCVALGIGMALAGVLVNPDLENVQAHCDRGRVLLIPSRVANVVRELSGVDQEGLSRGGCVPEEFRRVNLLPWGNARDLPARAQFPALVAWLVLLGLWCTAVVNVLRAGQRAGTSGARPS
jgi:hypothetical protein